MKRALIIISIIAVLSLSLNAFLLFSRTSSKELTERIERYEEQEKIQEELIVNLETDIDSLLNIPIVNTTIIKQKIYEDRKNLFTDINTIENTDSIVELWTTLSRK